MHPGSHHRPPNPSKQLPESFHTVKYNNKAIIRNTFCSTHKLYMTNETVPINLSNHPKTPPTTPQSPSCPAKAHLRTATHRRAAPPNQFQPFQVADDPKNTCKTLTRPSGLTSCPVAHKGTPQPHEHTTHATTRTRAASPRRPAPTPNPSRRAQHH